MYYQYTGTNTGPMKSIEAVQKGVEKPMDEACEQRGRFNEKGNKMILLRMS